MAFDPLDLCNRPLAAPGLISYRCKNSFSWTMIGARDDDEAFREALRSDQRASRLDLQRWNGTAYVPVHQPAQQEDPPTERAAQEVERQRQR